VGKFVLMVGEGGGGQVHDVCGLGPDDVDAKHAGLFDIVEGILAA